jgi:hypothetical protein
MRFSAPIGSGRGNPRSATRSSIRTLRGITDRGSACTSVSVYLIVDSRLGTTPSRGTPCFDSTATGTFTRMPPILVNAGPPKTEPRAGGSQRLGVRKRRNRWAEETWPVEAPHQPRTGPVWTAHNPRCTC